MRHALIIILALAFIICGSLQASDYIKVDIATTADINKIQFVDDYHGFAVTSDGELFATSDGGLTWKKRQICKRAITDIHVIGRSGYLTGERGLLMKSTDRGATWKDISQNIKFNFTGVGIVNDSTVFVCGTDQNSMSKTKGVIFKSYDYGQTWQKYGHLGNGYTDLLTQPPRKIYILAIKKAFHSINAGLNFFPGTYGGKRMGFGFDLTDDWGFMVGSKGLFASTTTHGRHWDEINIGVTKALFAVDIFDKESGVAVGQDGTVLWFHDSGAVHSVETCGFEEDLKTVCIAGDRVLMAGDDGLMIFTSSPKKETEAPKK